VFFYYALSHCALRFASGSCPVLVAVRFEVRDCALRALYKSAGAVQATIVHTGLPRMAFSCIPGSNSKRTLVRPRCYRDPVGCFSRSHFCPVLPLYSFVYAKPGAVGNSSTRLESAYTLWFCEYSLVTSPTLFQFPPFKPYRLWRIFSPRTTIRLPALLPESFSSFS